MNLKDQVMHSVNHAHVAGVSVHCQLAPLFLGCGEAECHGDGSRKRRCFSQGGQEADRERYRDRDRERLREIQKEFVNKVYSSKASPQ